MTVAVAHCRRMKAVSWRPLGWPEPRRSGCHGWPPDSGAVALAAAALDQPENVEITLFRTVHTKRARSERHWEIVSHGHRDSVSQIQTLSRRILARGDLRRFSGDALVLLRLVTSHRDHYIFKCHIAV